MQPAEQWKHSHNYLHHTFTNVLGRDNDIGYGILRISRDQKWRPSHLGNPIWNLLLATLFEWGVALHDLDIEASARARRTRSSCAASSAGRPQDSQAGRQGLLALPAADRAEFPDDADGNATANLMRNLWSYLVIFVDHFPDGVAYFTKEELEDETKGEWYLRQILGSANFRGRKTTHIMAGYLSYQIEHHLYPDLPSFRYPEIAKQTKAICEEYKIPYILGSLLGTTGRRSARSARCPYRTASSGNKDLDPIDPERSEHRSGSSPPSPDPRR